MKFLVSMTAAALCSMACTATSPAPRNAAAPVATSEPVSGAPSPKTASSLDARLQSAAEEAVRNVGRPAAVVALVPNTGVVLAASSVSGDRGDPLLTAHVPASTFKVFTTVAALESGDATPRTESTCTGTFDFHGKVLRCRTAHGKLALESAITQSCNSFFYALGARMDHRRVLEWAHRFGFGERTGIELDDAPGHVEDYVRADEIHRDPASTVPLLDAMGHGEIQVTLLQLARAFAAIANGGKLVTLTMHGAGAAGRNIGLAEATLGIVQDALADVVASPEGTAHDVAIDGFAYSGKTGSDETPTGEDKWFVAYGPTAAPEILVAARVENAEGTNDAKHVVRDVLMAHRQSAR